MPQYAILRFAKHKGAPSGALEAHHERKKERYASNPDIDTERSKYNFHIIKPKERYSRFIKHRIEESGCRTRKDSTRFVDTLVTASPEFFKGKSTQETAAYFKRATEFLADRVGRENIISAVVHTDEKTPHPHLTFVPLTKDNRLCAKEIIEKIFELALHGAGAAKITRILMEEKVSTPAWVNFQRNGTFAHVFEGADETKRYQWTISQVKSILKDENYIGNNVHNRQSTVSFKNKKVVRKPGWLPETEGRHLLPLYRKD